MNYPNRPVPACQIFRRIGPLLMIALTIISVQVSAQERPTLQVSFKRDANQTVKIDLLVGQARVIEFDQVFESAIVSDPEVAYTPPPVNARTLVINGRKFGQINIVVTSRAVLDKETNAVIEPAKMVILDVYVLMNLNQIDNHIKLIFPKENIQLSQANDAVVISGSVTKPEIADRVKEILTAAGFKQVVNLIKPPPSSLTQVELRIRVAEVNRRVLTEVGTAFGVLVPSRPGTTTAIGSLNPSGTGGSLSSATSQLALTLGNLKSVAVTDAFIRALQTRGAIRQLAEPNLVAADGHEASFLAGGEFPIPIVQGAAGGGNNAITVQFKQFGVQLKFTPTIKDENHIGLKLEPEVSDLDLSSAVTINGFAVPGLRTRKASTYIELADGQSFSLAGLLDNQDSVNVSKIPGLGDIPILGELFKSRSFQKRETELLFLCTVKLVEPLNPDQIPQLPGVAPGRAVPPPATPSSGLLEGEAGHAPASRKTAELMPVPEAKSAGAPAPARLDKTAKAIKP